MLVLIGAGASAALALAFRDSANALRKLLGLGALAALVAGFMFYELAAGPDLHGSGAPLEGVIGVIIAGSAIFFVSWAVGAVTVFGARSLTRRRRPPPLHSN